MIWSLENTYLTLPKELYTQCSPTPVLAPRLVIFNAELATELGLGNFEEKTDLLILAGNTLPRNTVPLAQAYAGHQFGHFNILGDGRALLLGEILTPQGLRFDLQLKGSGPTPYSRNGDGRAALGPMLREYIISEAMHHLGVPTTRSLAVVETGQSTVRETLLPGAILTRVAASHIRVGTFEYAASTNNVDLLKSLTLYTLQRHYPEHLNDENPALALLKEVSLKQAQLIAKWMSFGFIHGVMNTDNMTLSGETIDYGPCAFMNGAQWETVFSSIDRQGRYSFGNQPGIAQWNLARLAESLLPLIHPDPSKAQDLAINVIQNFKNQYEKFWHQSLVTKLGLEMKDLNLAIQFLDLVFSLKVDFTQSFRDLTSTTLPVNVLTQHPEFVLWHKVWKQKFSQKKEQMNQVNPIYIPRNHLVEEALQSAVVEKNMKPFYRLLKALSNPFTFQSEFDDLGPPEKLTNDGYKTFCGT